jgi:hypothetical protein
MLTEYIYSMYLPPLSTTMYCVPSSDIENPLSEPFSFSVGRYWQYMDAATYNNFGILGDILGSLGY